MSSRLFKRGPGLLFVEDNLPTIALPPPPAGGLSDADETEEISAYGAEDTDDWDDESSGDGAPLRVFLGSPGVSSTVDRDQLAREVDGPVWDASGITGAAAVAVPTAASSNRVGTLSRLGERHLRDPMADAAAALGSSGGGIPQPEGTEPPVQPISRAASMAPREAPAPRIATQDEISGRSEDWPSLPQSEWATDELRGGSAEWDAAADDDSWDAGAFGDADRYDEHSDRPGTTLTLELPPLVVPRNRLHDARTAVPMDLPTEPPRMHGDDDSMPIEAMEGSPEDHAEALSLPPHRATASLLGYGSSSDYGSASDYGSSSDGGGTYGGSGEDSSWGPDSARGVPDEDEDSEVLRGLPESEQFSWEVDDDGRGPVDPPTGVPLGVPRGSRLAGVRSSATPPKRPARPMPSFRPAPSGPQIPWGAIVLVVLMLALVGIGLSGALRGPGPGAPGATLPSDAATDQNAEPVSTVVAEPPTELPDSEAVVPSEVSPPVSSGLDPEVKLELDKLTGRPDPTAEASGEAPMGSSLEEGLMPELAAGRLVIKTDDKATVYINGERVGTTPLRTLSLAPGTYSVRAISVKSGRTEVATARVDSGSAREVRFKFE